MEQDEIITILDWNNFTWKRYRFTISAWNISLNQFFVNYMDRNSHCTRNLHNILRYSYTYNGHFVI